MTGREAQAVLAAMVKDPNTRDAGLALVVEVLAEVTTCLSPRVIWCSGTDGEAPLRVEVYKGDLAVRRQAQYAGQMRQVMGLRGAARLYAPEEDWS